jgi:hypothetical protein
MGEKTRNPPQKRRTQNKVKKILRELEESDKIC